MTKRIERKISEILELIQKSDQYIIPMEILAQLSQIQNTTFEVDEKIKARFLAALLKEYRKFKEVSSMRNSKKLA